VAKHHERLVNRPQLIRGTLMSIYYLFTRDGDVFELDATTDFTYSDPSDISQFKVEDGSTVADHVVNRNKKLSYSGIITDIKIASTERTKSTDTYIRKLLELNARREPFTAVWREDAGKPDGAGANSYRLPNCVFKNLTITQDQELGYAFGKHAYRVTLDIEQIRVARRAVITVEKSFALAVKDTTGGLDTSAGGTTEAVQEGPESSKLFSTIGNMGLIDAIKSVGPGKFNLGGAQGSLGSIPLP
jgi:hypothetical protein